MIKIACKKCEGKLGYFNHDRGIFIQCDCVNIYRNQSKLFLSNLPNKFFDKDFSVEFPECNILMDKYLNTEHNLDHMVIYSSFLSKRINFLGLLLKKILEERESLTGYYVDYKNMLLTVNRAWNDNKLYGIIDTWKNVDILCIAELNFTTKDNMNSFTISELLVERENKRKSTFITSLKPKQELCSYYSLDSNLYLTANLDNVEKKKNV